MKNKLCIILGFLILAILITTGCSSAAKKNYSKHEFLMDTIISIQAYGDDETKLKTEVTKAMGEFERIQLISNRFPAKGTKEYAQSEICQINANAGKAPVKVSSDVYKMIEMSLEYGKLSGGAFDISIGPLMDLWGFASGKMHVPKSADIKAILGLDLLANVQLDKTNSTVFLKKPGMILDLGGVAKGYAAQKAADSLRANGIKEALIDAGGNIVVIGKKDGTKPWRIGIMDPRNTENNVGILKLVDEAAVTSGDYQRNFTENGIMYHHILDPSTGMPARGTWSVTVITKDSGLADVLSTTLFVLGPEKGLEFIKGLKGVDAFYVGADKKIYLSDGLKGRIEVNAGNYSYTPKW